MKNEIPRYTHLVQTDLMTKFLELFSETLDPILCILELFLLTGDVAFELLYNHYNTKRKHMVRMSAKRLIRFVHVDRAGK